MTIELDTGWNLRSVMASRGIFQTSKLKPLLEDRGIDLSREQVYRLVTQPPPAGASRRPRCSVRCAGVFTRRSRDDHSPGGLGPGCRGRRSDARSIGDLRPVRATIRRPRTK